VEAGTGMSRREAWIAYSFGERSGKSSVRDVKSIAATVLKS
jgi:hypothetical protein